MGRKKTSEGHGEGNSERWLVTYSDLITLLLAFFIILYSMSNVDAEKYKKLAQALGTAIPGGSNSAGSGSGSGSGVGSNIKVSNEKGESSSKSKKEEPGTNNSSISEEFKDIEAKITKASQANHITGTILIREEGRGLILELTDNTLFETGKADLSEKSRKILFVIGSELSKIKNHIRVEGHTDNVPISTSLYPNNWHLSTARAMSVIDYWEQLSMIPPDRLSGAGYGEHRPIASNATYEGRAKNRRVDIVIIRNSVAVQEPSAVPADKTAGKAASGNKKPADDKVQHKSDSETASHNTKKSKH